MRSWTAALGWPLFMATLAVHSGRAAPAPSAEAMPGEGRGAVQTALSTAWDEHLAAAGRKDAAAVAAIYAPDVLYIVPGKQEVRGRPAIDLMEAQGLETTDVRDAVHTTEALQVVGEVAYELGTVKGEVRPHGQPSGLMTYHFMAMWQRQPDGAWRLRYLIGQ